MWLCSTRLSNDIASPAVAASVGPESAVATMEITEQVAPSNGA